MYLRMLPFLLNNNIKNDSKINEVILNTNYNFSYYENVYTKYGI